MYVSVTPEFSILTLFSPAFAVFDILGEIPYGTGFPSKFRVSTCSLTSSQAVEHDDTVTDDYVIDDEEDLPPAECCICLTEISVGDRCRVLPQCSHLFHTSCIGTWLKCSVRCPMCNGSLRDILNAEMWCGREQSRAFSHTAYAPPSLVCPPSSPMAVRGSRTQRTLSNSNFQSRGSGASLSDLSAVSSPQPVFLSKPLRSFSRVGIAGLEGEHLPSIYDSLVTNPYNSDSRSKAEAS